MAADLWAGLKVSSAAQNQSVAAYLRMLISREVGTLDNILRYIEAFDVD